MIHKYFYNIDELHDEFTFQEMMSSFLENCKETLWAMGEALWYVDYDD